MNWNIMQVKFLELQAPESSVSLRREDNYHLQARNYRLNRNGNLANLFSYACDNKKIKKLFTPTQNGITASVRYVSSTTVILTLGFTISFGARRQKKAIRNEETRKQ